MQAGRSGAIRFGAADAPENYGLSVGAGPRAKLYPYAALQKERVVQDRYDDRPLVIVYDRERHLATAFSVKLDEQVLAFKPAERSTLRPGGRCDDGGRGAAFTDDLRFCLDLVSKYKV